MKSVLIELLSEVILCIISILIIECVFKVDFNCLSYVFGGITYIIGNEIANFVLKKENLNNKYDREI